MLYGCGVERTRRGRGLYRGVEGVYAVVETGGKQYRVAAGQQVDVEKLDGQEGDEVTLDRVLLVAADGQTTVGTPTVAGARVLATIDRQFKDDKVIVFKFKAKKRYSRTRGHRQRLTRLSIREIIA
jgi:large subunit ribosomal protein L21